MSIIKNVDGETLHQWIESKQVLLIDVREAIEHNTAKIADSINIPLTQIYLENISLPEHTNKKIVIYCHIGRRSMTACLKLMETDPSLELWNLDGGILSWKQKGYDIIEGNTKK